MNVGLQAIVVCFCALAFSPSIQGAEFRCSSGDVACLIRAIDAANDNLEATNTITLEQGSYTLTQPCNSTSNLIPCNNISGPNDGLAGLLRVTSNLTIRGRGSDTTIIERDTAAVPFRIFNVGESGELTLSGLTIRQGDARQSTAFFSGRGEAS